MNYLVERMEQGHPVGDEQLAQSHGLLMVTKLHAAESATAVKEEFHLQLPATSQLIELFPGMLSNNIDDWGRIPTRYDLPLN